MFTQRHSDQQTEQVYTVKYTLFNLMCTSVGDFKMEPCISLSFIFLVKLLQEPHFWEVGLEKEILMFCVVIYFFTQRKC